MTPLSAVVIALDEEAQIGAALETVRFCDETLVVDAGSSDRTREIATAAGARVLVNAPWPGFVAQRNFATEQARHDWVLALDADERVTPALRDEIQALRAGGFAHAGYRIPRVAYYLGRWIRGTDWYPDPQLRLFDRRRGRWRGALVHESVRVEGGVGRLRSELEHFSYADLSDHLRAIDRYTSLWARESFEAGRRTSMAEMAGAAGFAFVRNYLLRRGLLLGGAGFVVSAMNSYYTFAKLAKLHELASGDGRAAVDR
ncbi:MAG TPA: glycosyltransferase family 2 protein [Vicinamibacteria bacterium]|nr:glycosyltransferase family 2 protein [Vicinamibacteria bacterium]